VTRAAVRQRLPAAGWAHFACHAATQSDPVDSFLALSDGAVTVRELNQLDIAGAELAYLSACATAFPGTRLVDESIHIATAFRVAGYRHVIATLWPVVDIVARDFAEHTYRKMMHGASPAYALHSATHEMRELYLEEPALWASHVHTGP
jgi:CHAT domain-containing protein